MAEHRELGFAKRAFGAWRRQVSGRWVLQRSLELAYALPLVPGRASLFWGVEEDLELGQPVRGSFAHIFRPEELAEEFDFDLVEH